MGPLVGALRGSLRLCWNVLGANARRSCGNGRGKRGVGWLFEPAVVRGYRVVGAGEKENFIHQVFLPGAHNVLVLQFQLGSFLLLHPTALMALHAR